MNRTEPGAASRGISSVDRRGEPPRTARLRRTRDAAAGSGGRGPSAPGTKLWELHLADGRILAAEEFDPTPPARMTRLGKLESIELAPGPQRVDRAPVPARQRPLRARGPRHHVARRAGVPGRGRGRRTRGTPLRCRLGRRQRARTAVARHDPEPHDRRDARFPTASRCAPPLDPPSRVRSSPWFWSSRRWPGWVRRGWCAASCSGCAARTGLSRRSPAEPRDTGFSSATCCRIWWAWSPSTRRIASLHCCSPRPRCPSWASECSHRQRPGDSSSPNLAASSAMPGGPRFRPAWRSCRRPSRCRRSAMRFAIASILTVRSTPETLQHELGPERTEPTLSGR